MKQQQDKCYRVAWVSKITGATGGGTTLLTYDEAQETCDKLNAEYPELDHYPVFVPNTK